MIKLNLFAISSLLITAAYLPLFFFIFTKGKTKLSKVYSLHILSVLLWGIGSFLVATTTDPNLAIVRWKFAYIWVLFIPVFFYHTIHLITKNNNKILLLLTYTQAILFTLLIVENKVFLSLRYVFNEFYVFYSSSPYMISFILWELIVIVGHIDLLKFIKKLPESQKKAILMFIFTGVGFLGGTINFLIGFNLNIYPYGNFLIPIHSFGISYAILKHRLFDIEVVFRKSIVYSILFTTITLLFLLLVISTEKIIQYFYGYTSPIISITIVLLIGVLSIPLRNAIQRIVDHIFFRKSHIEIVTENERLHQEIIQTEKLKSITTFASGMAHEIKNPLTAIKIFCEYLPQKVHDQEFLDKFIPIVTREADRINELVHDLLDYAKPSPPEVTPTDIHKLINDVLSALSAQIINKKTQIVRDFDKDNLETILVDHKQIKQVLLNIFLNALESMASNGSILISTRLSSNEKNVTIKITDSGCGISAEDLPHIFDPFFTKKEKGTGLGLSITHGIIKEHGGKIFVESALGRGTTFRIELPLQK